MSNELTTKGDNASLFAPENFEHAWRIATMLAKSQFAPKAFKDKPEDCLIAMEYGRQVGLAPMPAIQNIAVINGKPGLYGDMLLAVCQGHKNFENIIEEEVMNGNTIDGYSCTIIRKGREPVTRKFTVDDAKKAGLWSKPGVWSQYPGRMLQMRARGFALRDSFADALGGIMPAEELMDYSKEKDITPPRGKESIKQSVKELVGKAEMVIEEKPKPTVTLDELSAIRDLIKENKIPVQRVRDELKELGVSHIEHLMTEQVDELISNLLK